MIGKFRKILATYVQNYADSARTILELEARGVLLEQQRDLLARELTALRSADPPDVENLRHKLKVTLARFDAIPDGEPSALELVDAITSKLRAFDEREAEAIDIAERRGLVAYSSPALVETLLDRIDVLEEKLENLPRTEELGRRLGNYRVCVNAAIEDLAVSYSSKKSIQSLVGKLHRLTLRDLSDFDELRSVRLTQPEPAMGKGAA